MQLHLFEYDFQLQKLFRIHRHNLIKAIEISYNNSDIDSIDCTFPVRLMKSHTNLFRYLKDNRVKYKISSKDVAPLINPCLVVTRGRL